MSLTKRDFQTGFALGSEVTLTLASQAAPDQVESLYRDLWLAIYRFERQFSRFLPGSELSVFNRAAGLKHHVSPEFYEILRTAKRLSTDTGGLFNPFILPALQRAGYTQSFAPGYAKDVSDNHASRRVASPNKLELDDGWARIPFGSAIDLGGCGKGYLADYLADNLMPDWVMGFWLSFGGDIVGEGRDETGAPWSIDIYNAADPTVAGPWQLKTSGQRFAAATSGTRVRVGEKNGRPWHHIIDPRTLEPAETDVTAATVYIPSAVRADVLATCAVILGVSDAVPFLKGQGVAAALLQAGTDTASMKSSSFGSALHKQTSIDFRKVA